MEEFRPFEKHKRNNLWENCGGDSFGAIVIEEGPEGPMVLMVKSLKGWSFPKGHAEEGEEPLRTAEREVLEETGVLIEADPSFSRAVPSIKKHDNRTVTFFIGKSLCGLKTPVPREVPDAAWVPLDEAAGRIEFPLDRAACEDAIAHWKEKR